MTPRLSRRSALGLAGAVAGTVLARPVLALDPAQPAPVLDQSRAERALTIISPALTEADARAAMPAGAFEYVHGGAACAYTSDLR